jgi:hypothetical protein
LSFISIIQKATPEKQDLRTKLFFLCEVAGVGVGGEIRKALLSMALGEEAYTLDKIKKEGRGSFHSQ